MKKFPCLFVSLLIVYSTATAQQYKVAYYASSELYRSTAVSPFNDLQFFVIPNSPEFIQKHHIKKIVVYLIYPLSKGQSATIDSVRAGKFEFNRDGDLTFYKDMASSPHYPTIFKYQYDQHHHLTQLHIQDARHFTDDFYIPGDKELNIKRTGPITADSVGLISYLKNIYDSTGRLLKTEKLSDKNKFQPFREYAYDPRNERLIEKKELVTGKNILPHSETTTYAYDSTEHTLTTSVKTNYTADIPIREDFYDQSGRCIKTFWALNNNFSHQHISLYAYNTDGTVSQIIDYLLTGTPIYHFHYSTY